MIGVAHVFAVRGDFEGVEADGEGAFHRFRVAGDRQRGRGGSLRAEAKLVEVCDDFGDVGRVRAKALFELRWCQKLMKLCVSWCVDGGEKFFGFVAVAHAKSNGNGEWRFRAECSAIDRFGSFTAWIGKSNSPFNGSVGLGLSGSGGDKPQQDEARHKHSYGEFQWVPPREKIYRAEIFVKSRTTATDTLSGGDSVCECLHPGLANCQLDIFKER